MARYTVPENILQNIEELSRKIDTNSGYTYVEAIKKFADVSNWYRLWEKSGLDSYFELVGDVTSTLKFAKDSTNPLDENPDDLAEISCTRIGYVKHMYINVYDSEVSGGTIHINETVDFTFQGNSAPPSYIYSTPTNMYGGSGKVLGDPDGWIPVMINGQKTKIPVYHY